MRREAMPLPDEGEAEDKQDEQTATEGVAPSLVATERPVSASNPSTRTAGKLTALMALEEPARTEALEKATTAGLTVSLRSRTGKDVRWRYGEHTLVVPPEPKPFAAAHAIHLLFTAPHLVEEVED